MNLWGNKCDLSLSAGSEVSQILNPITMINAWQDNIIIDDGAAFYKQLVKIKESVMAGQENIYIGELNLTFPYGATLILTC